MSSSYWQEFWTLSLQSLLLVCIWMLLLWLVHLWMRNAAIVDAGWALGISFCAVLYATQGSGAMVRRSIIATMVVIWGLRLGLYLLLRMLGQPEEGRYAELRRKWGGNINLKFLAFYQIQALSCVLLAVPFLLASLDPRSELNLLEQFSIVLWVAATAGVTIADFQLSRFKANKQNHGKVCRQGLWGWSRHPNYFFEWLIWVSYGLYALSSPWGILGLVAPALIFHFVVNVTGIPPTEEQAVRTKGAAYLAYQKEVSAFIPMFPKTTPVR